MLSNAYFLAKFRFDTAENEPAKNLQNFRKMHFRCPSLGMTPAGMRTTANSDVWYKPPTTAVADARRRLVRERRLAKFRQNVARFRLYRLRFLQQNMRFAAFFKIYQIFKLKFLKFGNLLQILRHLRNFC